MPSNKGFLNNLPPKVKKLVDQVQLEEVLKPVLIPERKVYERGPRRYSTALTTNERDEIARAERREEEARKAFHDLVTVTPPEPEPEPELPEIFIVPEKKGEWDFAINDKIPFFDVRLSYELTGYKPINEIEGLDFDPEAFIEARRSKEQTGHYT
ncbi:MAG: hypothetical protein Nk1A_8800 [Endomicrobiia bacterium]|nr:MAG: hypothetical protein Nk1A_8800 [Endomicrobiia bacterium]